MFYKQTFNVPISKELLKDAPPWRLRTYTDDEWSAHVRELRTRRRAMDTIGTSPAEKRRQTWRIKRALAVTEFPHLGYEDAQPADERLDLDREE
jgi:hypothetical protein